MACSYTRQDVSDIVVAVIRGIQNDRTITENSAFGTDIIVDSTARRLYASPIIKSVNRPPDCILKKFSEDDCAQAQTVKDIVDAVWSGFNPNN